MDKGGTGNHGGSSGSSPDASTSGSGGAVAADASSAGHDAGQDAGEEADASAPRYRLCSFEDSCGTRQGPMCPAAPPRGTCTASFSCFYCSELATTNADTEIRCDNGKWTQKSAQACRP